MKVLFLFLFFSTTLHAGGLSDCGEYTLRGVIRPLEDGLTIVVNEKTQSELRISMPIPEQGKIGGYINKPVTVRALLNKKFDGTKGYTTKIISSKFRLPDPLNPKDTGVNLEKKIACIKDL